MTVVRIVQPHTVDKVARQVQDANQIVGERMMLVRLYSAHRVSDNWPHCEYCYSDVYKHSSSVSGICPHCYGTGYKNGISSIWFTSAIATDPANDEQYDKDKGETYIQRMKMQFSSAVRPDNRDIVFRIDGWKTSEKGLKPILSKPYRIEDKVNYVYFRDGYSYIGDQNVVAYTCSIARFEQDHPISNIMINGLSKKLITDNVAFAIYPDQTYDSFKLAKHSL
jgi:hypothetical protein